MKYDGVTKEYFDDLFNVTVFTIIGTSENSNFTIERCTIC